MASSNKSKDVDSRKRKFNENQSKILSSSSVTNKPSSRVLKPSSLTNLVEMVRKHTVYAPRDEISNGEALEGLNFVKFLQQNLNIVETPVTLKAQEPIPVEKPEPKSVSLKQNKINDNVVKISKPNEKTGMHQPRTSTPEPGRKSVQKRKANKEFHELCINNEVEYVVAQYDGDQIESNAINTLEQIELDQGKIAQNIAKSNLISESNENQFEPLGSVTPFVNLAEDCVTGSVKTSVPVVKPTCAVRSPEKVVIVLSECLVEEDNEKLVEGEKNVETKESANNENGQEIMVTSQRVDVHQTNVSNKIHETNEANQEINGETNYESDKKDFNYDNDKNKESKDDNENKETNTEGQKPETNNENDVENNVTHDDRNEEVVENNNCETEEEYYEYEYDENGRAYYYDENGALYYYDEETGESYPDNSEEYEQGGEVYEEEVQVGDSTKEENEVVYKEEHREEYEELGNDQEEIIKKTFKEITIEDEDLEEKEEKATVEEREQVLGDIQDNKKTFVEEITFEEQMTAEEPEQVQENKETFVEEITLEDEEEAEEEDEEEAEEEEDDEEAEEEDEEEAEEEYEEEAEEEDESISEEPKQVQKDIEDKKETFVEEIMLEGEDLEEEEMYEEEEDDEEEDEEEEAADEPEQVPEDIQDKDSFIEEIRSPEGEDDEEEEEGEEEVEEEQDDNEDIPCIDLVDGDDIEGENERNSTQKECKDNIPSDVKLTIPLLKLNLDSVMRVIPDVNDETPKISSLLSVEARGLITPTKNELSINTDFNKSLADPFSQLDEEYVKTLTPTLTLHDEEVEEEEFGLQPLITEEELSEKEIPANKPLVLEKLAQIKDEDLDGKSSSNESFHVDQEEDSDLEELHPTFRAEKAESIPSPRTSYEQTMRILRANKSFSEKAKDVEERLLAPIPHNKVEQDFQEFLDEDGGQVFVNRISEPAPGFKVFNSSKCFAYCNYKHLPYLKRFLFEKPESNVEKLFANMSCCDLLSSMLIEKGIQEFFTSLSEQKSEEFLLFLWKVACCHPNYQIVTKTVEFFKLANQELPLTWHPSFDLILETLINFGLNDTDNNCPFTPEFEAISARLSQESNALEELEESGSLYRIQILNKQDLSKLPVNNLAAMLEILSFSIDKSLQVEDILVLLVWVSMDPQVRAMNLRSKIQKCIENAIHNCPELFFGNCIRDLSKRLIELCIKHDDALCLVRGLPPIGKARELQKIVSMGVLKLLLNVQDGDIRQDDTIEDLVLILNQYKITPKMDLHFLHSVISLIEIFVGNDVSPTQRVPLKQLSQILNRSLAKVADNYINPENSALKLHLFLIKSKWQILGQSNCDEKVFTQFSCLEGFKN